MLYSSVYVYVNYDLSVSDVSSNVYDASHT